MYPCQIAENTDAGHIFAVKCKHARSLGAQSGGAIRGRNVSMNRLVMQVIRRCDFHQQSSNHLDYVRDRHGTNLVLALLGPLPRCLVPLREELFTGKALNV